MVTKGTQKNAAKKAKTTKNSVVRDMKANDDLPSPELTADLAEVFTRHGWTGLPRNLSFANASGCDRKCPDGSTAQPAWIKCPDGSSKMVCICPGDDPSCEGE
jgi:hypothetical protein